MDIFELSKHLGFRKYETKRSKCGYGYKGVFTNDGICDSRLGHYRVGLYEIDVVEPLEINHCVMAITTIDDGVWMAFCNNTEKLNIDELVKEYEEIFYHVVPNEKDLNDFLATYKIYGTFEG